MSAGLDPPAPIFLRYELDGDGHARQLLALRGETLELYPILDPVSLEHALAVERTILPEIVALYETDPRHAAFAGFHTFFAHFSRIQQGDGAACEDIAGSEARALEALRASINERTPQD